MILRCHRGSYVLTLIYFYYRAQVIGTQANTMTSPQIQQSQVRISNPAGASAANAAAAIASGHRAGGVQVRNPSELMATPTILTLEQWWGNELKNYSPNERKFMEEQVQTWKTDLSEANQDDFSFQELFEELSSDESFEQHK